MVKWGALCSPQLLKPAVSVFKAQASSSQGNWEPQSCSPAWGMPGTATGLGSHTQPLPTAASPPPRLWPPGLCYGPGWEAPLWSTSAQVTRGSADVDVVCVALRFWTAAAQFSG